MTTAFPSTGEFPAEPTALEREELDAVYLDLRKSYRGLIAIDCSLASIPSSAVVKTERHAIQQRRAMLRIDRNKSRKHLRRESLRSSLNVWDENQTAEE